MVFRHLSDSCGKYRSEVVHMIATGIAFKEGVVLPCCVKFWRRHVGWNITAVVLVDGYAMFWAAGSFVTSLVLRASLRFKAPYSATHDVKTLQKSLRTRHASPEKIRGYKRRWKVLSPDPNLFTKLTCSYELLLCWRNTGRFSLTWNMIFLFLKFNFLSQGSAARSPTTSLRSDQRVLETLWLTIARRHF